jgi:hypothetical protein
MASHQMVNYEPMHGSHRRLTSLLRDELGFGPGYIAADAANVAALYTNQMVASSFEAAAALAATAGLDQDLSGMVDTLRSLGSHGAVIATFSTLVENEILGHVGAPTKAIILR